jgi:signal transduction histidine kinase
MQLSSLELDRWFHDHVSAHTYARLMSARDAEPAFRVLSVEWNITHALMVAMRAVPTNDRMSTAQWIAHVISGYMATMPPETLDGLDAVAFGQFAVGVSWSGTDTRDYFDGKPLPPPEWFDNWEAFLEGDKPVLNRLVRDYLIARRIAHEVDSGRIEILTRHQFPKEYVLLFLAVISPSAAERAAEVHTQIEAEVERRLYLTLAHQLRRPVGALRMHVKSIRKTIPRDAAERLGREFSRIEEELSYLSALADRTSQWHNVPNGPDEPLVLRDMVVSEIDLLRQRHQQVACEIDVGASIRVRAKRSALRDLLYHIIENAFQAVAFAGPAEPRVRLHSIEGGATTVLYVSNNGPGIRPSERERIFEPFVTTKKGGDQPHGTGLGLAIARRCAESMGGRVGLDADQPETCFFVELLAWRES